MVIHRERNPDERLPAISVNGHDGILHVSVARLALCDTQVQAGVSRAGGAFDVVAVIGPNAAALCAQNNGRYVVEYQMDVPRVALGFYEVRVFEGGFTAREPRFMGQSRTWVGGPSQ